MNIISFSLLSFIGCVICLVTAWLSSVKTNDSNRKEAHQTFIGFMFAFATVMGIFWLASFWRYAYLIWDKQ